MKSKLLTLLAAAAFSVSAHAGPIIDNPAPNTPVFGGALLVATDGHVQAEFLGSLAGYVNVLYLDTASDWGPGGIFTKYTPLHKTVDLGSFTAGTELIFRLRVLGHAVAFFSGDAGRNPDGLAHAMAMSTLLDDGSHLATIGFEDFLGGGDLDYNDFIFSLTNIAKLTPPATRVSAPAMLTLLGTGLAVMALARRRFLSRARA